MSESQTSSLHVENYDDVLILKILMDELREMKSCYEVRDRMLQVIDPESTRSAILDLSQVNFIGSMGLLGFLAVRRKIPESRLFVCGASESLFEMLSLCRLISPENQGDPPFEWRSTVPECLQALES